MTIAMMCCSAPYAPSIHRIEVWYNRRVQHYMCAEQTTTLGTVVPVTLAAYLGRLVSICHALHAASFTCFLLSASALADWNPANDLQAMARVSSTGRTLCLYWIALACHKQIRFSLSVFLRFLCMSHTVQTLPTTYRSRPLQSLICYGRRALQVYVGRVGAFCLHAHVLLLSPGVA